MDSLAKHPFRVIGRTCPDHPGKSTATLMIDEPIGREDLATEEICQEFLSDSEPTYLRHITTDGDSAASRGVQKAMGVHGQTVEALRDTRHLAQSQKKAIDNAKFGERIFPGRTSTDKSSVNIMATGHDEDALLGPSDDETSPDSKKKIFSALKTVQSTMESVATGINKMGDAFTALAAANPQQKVTDLSTTSLSAQENKKRRKLPTNRTSGEDSIKTYMEAKVQTESESLLSYGTEFW
uniref:Uncharacterized protein n=1 Tax=Magallana gigas TaxID=29159 RepID=A0A8W8MKQ1_MAGGI